MKLIFAAVLFVLGLVGFVVSGRAATTVTYSVSPGGTYSTVDAAINAANDNGDLVALDTAVDVVISGSWVSADTTAVSVDGFASTDADNNITIRTTGDARHAGVWDNTKYRLVRNTTDYSPTPCISVLEAYVRISGIQLERGDVGGMAPFLMQTADGLSQLVLLESVIFRRAGQAVAGAGVMNYSYYAATQIRNCVFYGINHATYGAIDTTGGNQKAYVYNCTFVDCTRGIRISSGDTGLMKNCLFVNCGTTASGTFIAGTDYNATSAAAMGYTVTGGGNTHDRTSVTVSFVDAAQKDYHLAASDTGVKDQGADLSVTFTVDIDGQTRTGTWDIGADEYQAAAGGAAVQQQPMILRGWRW